MISYVKWIKINEAFKVIEADERYSDGGIFKSANVCVIPSPTTSFNGSRRVQLPDILFAIRNLHTIDFDADEYNIKRRLTCLIDRWDMTFSFFDQSQDQGQVALVRIHGICDITMSLKSSYAQGSVSTSGEA